MPVSVCLYQSVCDRCRSVCACVYVALCVNVHIYRSVCAWVSVCRCVSVRVYVSVSVCALCHSHLLLLLLLFKVGLAGSGGRPEQRHLHQPALALLLARPHGVLVGVVFGLDNVVVACGWGKQPHCAFTYGPSYNNTDIENIHIRAFTQQHRHREHSHTGVHTTTHDNTLRIRRHTAHSRDNSTENIQHGLLSQYTEGSTNDTQYVTPTHIHLSSQEKRNQ